MGLPFLLRNYPGVLFIGVVLMIVCFYLLLVRHLQLSDIAWKRVDYVWLSVALLGVLATSRKAVDTLFFGQVSWVEYATNSSYETLRQDLERAANPESKACAPQVRSQNSPPDFDSIVKAQQDVCEQFTALNLAMPPFPNSPTKKFLPVSGLHFQPVTMDEKYKQYVNWGVDRINSDAAEYEQLRRLYSDLAGQERESVIETVDFAAGPFLIGIAIALRFTKALGEISNAKKKLNTSPNVSPGRKSEETSEIQATAAPAVSQPVSVQPTPTLGPESKKLEPTESVPPEPVPPPLPDSDKKEGQ